MRRFVRTLSLVLALVLALGACAFAEKAHSVKVWATEQKVLVYAQKSLNSKVVGKFYYGQSVTAASYDENKVWAKVTGKNGKTGYVFTYDVSDRDPNIHSLKLIIKKKATVYAAPYKSSRKVATRAKGKTVTAVSVVPGYEWFRIKTKTGYGYIQASLCKARNYAWFTGTNVYIESRHSSVLSYAEKVDIVGTYKGYTLIYFNGGKRLGVVKSTRFSMNEPQAAGTAAYAAADGATLFSEAVFSSYYKAKTLNKNTKVRIMYGSDALGFYVVRYGGKDYYMWAQTLVKEKKDTYIRLTVKRNASLYSGKSFEQKNLIGILLKDQQVKLIKVTATKAYVKSSSGEKGWCYLKDLEK